MKKTPDTDYLDEAGARLLARRIQDFWHGQGVAHFRAFHCEIPLSGCGRRFGSNGSRFVWVVRSNYATTAHLGARLG